MAANKDTKGLGMPWEQDPGYAQGVKVGNTIHVAGQVAHDDAGQFVGLGDHGAQMEQAYANIEKVLTQYGASLSDVVEETIFTTSIDATFPALGPVRRKVYGGAPRVANTLVEIQRLAFPELLVEIKCVAIV